MFDQLITLAGSIASRYSAQQIITFLLFLAFVYWLAGIAKGTFVD